MPGRILSLLSIVCFVSTAAQSGDGEVVYPAGDPLAYGSPPAAKVAVLYSDRFLLHDTGPGHPERPELLASAVARLRDDRTLSSGLVWPKIHPATREALEAVHSPEYIRRVKEEVLAAGLHGSVSLSTGDTMISAATWEAATLAAGGGIRAGGDVRGGG